MDHDYLASHSRPAEFLAHVCERALQAGHALDWYTCPRLSNTIKVPIGSGEKVHHSCTYTYSCKDAHLLADSLGGHRMQSATALVRKTTAPTCMLHERGSSALRWCGFQPPHA